jgi:predicted TIM-barrel fold metal-dependent hydrolase
MASRGEELLISADSHIVEDPHFWENRLPAAFKDQAPLFPEREVGGLFQAHPGGWDPHERVKEMAVDGVSGEVLYPSFAMNLFGLQDAALQEACFRTYNDWILEYCSVAPDRLYGVSCIPTYDIDHGVAELERCRKGGLLGALVWQAPPPELSFATTHYERLWAAAQDLRRLGRQQSDVVQRLSPSEFDMAQVLGRHHTRSGAPVGGDADTAATRERAAVV